MLSKAASLVLLTLSGIAAEAEQTAPQTASAKAMFQWFDSLGLSKTFSAKLVSIRYHYKDFASRAPGRFSEPEYGFIESQTAEAGVILLPSLIERRYDKNPKPTSGIYPPVVAETDLKDWLELRIRSIKKHLADNLNEGYLRYHRPDQKCETFVLARIAALHGLVSLSVQLFDLANQESYKVYGDEPSDFEGRVKYDIGQVLVDDASLSLNGPVANPSHALARLEVVSKSLPESSVRRRAEADVASIRHHVDPGNNRHPLSDAERAKLPVPDQIAELIWDLKDQTLQGPFRTQAPILFDTFKPGTHDSPADKLYRFGFDAVPALIEALRDTRAVNATNPSYQLVIHYPLQVQDVALQLLRQISGREFASSSLVLPRPPVAPTPENSAIRFTGEKPIEAVISDAKAWWESARFIGEKEYMVRALVSGSNNPMAVAQNMVMRYLNDAPAAIEKAVLNSSDPNTQAQLIYSLESLKSDSTIRIARRLMHDGPSLSARLRAAGIINLSDPNSATAAMIAECATPSNFLQDIQLTDSLARFLLESCQVQAVKSVAALYKSGSPEIKCQLAMTIDGWWCQQLANLRLKMSERDLDEANRSLEVVFAEGLAEKIPLFHAGFNFGNDRSENPRPCDIASYILAKLYPTKYQGEWTPSELRRDDQCASNLNTWRQSQNLPPLPFRFSSAITHLSPTARNTVISVFVENIPDDVPKLANHAENSKGKILTSEALSEMISEMTSACAGHRRTGRIYLTRDFDGIKLSLNVGVIEPDSSGIRGNSNTFTWAANVSAVVSGTSASGNGGITLDVYNQIQKAFAAPIEIPFSVEVTIHG